MRREVHKTTNSTRRGPELKPSSSILHADLEEDLFNIIHKTDHATGKPITIRHLWLTDFKRWECQQMQLPHNHKTCYYFHSNKDRRRDDNLYSPELCKYAETERCPKKSRCNFAHNRVERLYHKEKYKSKFCLCFGSPSKVRKCEYGDYCSFAHSVEDIKARLIHHLVSNNQDMDFFIFNLKTEWCPFNTEHNKAQCIYAHNFQDFRRNPSLFKYDWEMCEEWQSGTFITSYKEGCPRMQNCTYSHGWKEQQFHPLVYKTLPCEEVRCFKGFECPFYHPNSDDKRTLDMANRSPDQIQQLFVPVPRKVSCKEQPDMADLFFANNMNHRRERYLLEQEQELYQDIPNRDIKEAKNCGITLEMEGQNQLTKNKSLEQEVNSKQAIEYQQNPIKTRLTEPLPRQHLRNNNNNNGVMSRQNSTKASSVITKDDQEEIYQQLQFSDTNTQSQQPSELSREVIPNQSQYQPQFQQLYSNSHLIPQELITNNSKEFQQTSSQIGLNNQIRLHQQLSCSNFKHNMNNQLSILPQQNFLKAGNSYHLASAQQKNQNVFYDQVQAQAPTNVPNFNHKVLPIPSEFVAKDTRNQQLYNQQIFQINAPLVYQQQQQQYINYPFVHQDQILIQNQQQLYNNGEIYNGYQGYSNPYQSQRQVSQNYHPQISVATQWNQLLSNDRINYQQLAQPAVAPVTSQQKYLSLGGQFDNIWSVDANAPTSCSTPYQQSSLSVNNSYGQFNREFIFPQQTNAQRKLTYDNKSQFPLAMANTGNTSYHSSLSFQNSDRGSQHVNQQYLGVTNDQEKVYSSHKQKLEDFTDKFQAQLDLIDTDDEDADQPQNDQFDHSLSYQYMTKTFFNQQSQISAPQVHPTETSLEQSSQINNQLGVNSLKDTKQQVESNLNECENIKYSSKIMEQNLSPNIDFVDQIWDSNLSQQNNQ